MKVQVPGSQSLEGLLHKSNMSPDLKDIAALKHKVGREVGTPLMVLKISVLSRQFIYITFISANLSFVGA